ncbi:hypothetical protein P152DRAFT_388370 [Eremomyces bilateralis CBS 781.70]|uniref:TMEM205-like domain-containing protein n=1 Tax=Eremomyces bilateralis CBS 781.70 TaxID=1392243 RepID=A0A6G1GEI4_9PEZI|nr:uncharacterized protein P152DRAFT_388370 [Eremomyces bilateralis CBS 781.70]KAF1816525.1 hypothetical protein P152DRAFT_388370 [Eremomyces bilateralis CBS 781.70]
MDAILSPTPYHILSYGTLLGANLYNTFVASILSFRTLPRPHFSALQSASFPIYFTIQTALPLAMALTYPSPSTSSSGPRALLAHGTLATKTLLAIMFLGGLVNKAVLGPMTNAAMRRRKAQETREGKRAGEGRDAPVSGEMRALNRRFGVLHGVSSLVNLASVLASVGYAFELSQRIA